jgi:DNA-binding NarL/FixJ family response regulator
MDTQPGLSQVPPRALSRNAVVLGMALLLGCMAFFVIDVIVDIVEHVLSRTPYGASELVHLVFEILAVGGLSYAALTLRAYLRLSRAEAARSKETIQMLRGNFDAVLREKFDEWGLTAAERDVTLLIIRGLSGAEIAAARNTAQGTIKAQSTSIFRKIGVGSKTELMSAIIDEFLDARPRPDRGAGGSSGEEVAGG